MAGSDANDGATASLTFVGTSNSLLRDGYTTPVKRAYPGHANISLGASSFTLLGYNAPRLRARRGDTVIVDMAVTDHAIHRHIPTNVAHHRRMFEAFLVDCAERDQFPVILVMPSSWRSAYAGEIRALYRGYAEQFGVPIMDGFAFVERLYALRPDLAHHGLVSSAHLDPLFARMIGRLLVSSIATARAECTAQAIQVADALRFDTVAIAPHVADDNVIPRRTSAANAVLARFVPGDRAVVPVPEDAILYGYSINAGASHGYLRFEGADVVEKDIRSGRYAKPDSLILTAWVLRDGVRPRDGAIVLEMLPALGDAAVREVCEVPMPQAQGRMETIEIESLIVARPRGPATRIARAGPLELLALASDADLLEAVRIEEAEAAAAAEAAAQAAAVA